MKLVAGKEQLTNETPETEKEIGEKIRLLPIVNHTIRIARLKMLFIAAKITTHERVTTIKYSEHDARASELIGFMDFLDSIRNSVRPWDAISAEMAIP